MVKNIEKLINEKVLGYKRKVTEEDAIKILKQDDVSSRELERLAADLNSYIDKNGNHVRNAFYYLNINSALKLAEDTGLFQVYDLHQDKETKKWQIGFGSDGAYFEAKWEHESLPYVICMACLGRIGVSVNE